MLVLDPKTQYDPLLPGYSFNLYLVAGTTPIIENGPLDFFIDRPNGMEGFIINLTIRGQGKVFDGTDAFLVNPGDMMLFPPEAVHYYGRSPESPDWYHRWVYFRPRAYWAHWLSWPNQTRKVGRFSAGTGSLFTEFDELFAKIDQTHREEKRTAEELAINLLERLLIRCYEEIPDNQVSAVDKRILAACQFIAKNLASDIGLEEVARHVCLSPSRLAHVFRKQMGVNLLKWREDQRIILAKHLLQNTHASISHIAGRVGYDDQLYFSRVFRKREGVSPSAFRKTAESQHAADESPVNPFSILQDSSSPGTP